MAVDDRIKFLVREEVQLVLAEADLGAGELREEPGLISRLDDLHTEIHALATAIGKLESLIARDTVERNTLAAKVAALEDRLKAAPRETAVSRTRQAMGK